MEKRNVFTWSFQLLQDDLIRTLDKAGLDAIVFAEDLSILCDHDENLKHEIDIVETLFCKNKLETKRNRINYSKQYQTGITQDLISIIFIPSIYGIKTLWVIIDYITT